MKAFYFEHILKIHLLAELLHASLPIMFLFTSRACFLQHPPDVRGKEKVVDIRHLQNLFFFSSHSPLYFVVLLSFLKDPLNPIFEQDNNLTAGREYNFQGI